MSQKTIPQQTATSQSSVKTTSVISDRTPAEMLQRLKDAEKAIRRCLSSVDPTAEDPDDDLIGQVEVSVVMPCLNEADTLASCIMKASQAMERHGIHGEVIVADNGSYDGSVEIAKKAGARVVHVKDRGYGSALMGGIEAAAGKYVIMGDADDSYDFHEIPKFVEQLRLGHELVQGCRLPSGGGKILKGAMPLLHRWWGNPMFSWMVRRMFGAPIHDVYCGLRGFSRKLYDRLDLRSTGMEFATEMIIKSSLFGVDMMEVPTTLHPDGRTSHAPHLRTFRDGWRTLRFFLMYSPRWLFSMPGMLLCLAGLLGYALAMPGASLFGARLDAHTLLISSLVMMLGFQLIQFGLFAKTFAVTEGLLPVDEQLSKMSRIFSLERCLMWGALMFLLGGGLIYSALSQWQAASFGQLDYATTMRWVIPGVTLAVLGFQTVFSSFFISILRMGRKK